MKNALKPYRTLIEGNLQLFLQIDRLYHLSHCEVVAMMYAFDILLPWPGIYSPAMV